MERDLADQIRANFAKRQKSISSDSGLAFHSNSVASLKIVIISVPVLWLVRMTSVFPRHEKLTVEGAFFRFIEKDLASVNRSQTPWLIVGGHRPIYISSTFSHWPDGDLEVAHALKLALEPLLYKHKVR